jgi:hypothetical protein
VVDQAHHGVNVPVAAGGLSSYSATTTSLSLNFTQININ